MVKQLLKASVSRLLTITVVVILTAQIACSGPAVAMQHPADDAMEPGVFHNWAGYVVQGFLPGSIRHVTAYYTQPAIMCSQNLSAELQRISMWGGIDGYPGQSNKTVEQ